MMILIFCLAHILIGSEGCNNNVVEKYEIKETNIGRYCNKRNLVLKYISPDVKYALLQETPASGKWKTIFCKLNNKSIERISYANSYNGQKISPVSLTPFNQIAWTFVHQNSLMWKIYDIKKDVFKQVKTTTTIFGPNFLIEDFVIGFDARSKNLLRIFNQDKVAAEQNKKNNWGCLDVKGNLLLFDFKNQRFIDTDALQYHESICLLSHNKKMCLVSQYESTSLYLITFNDNFFIHEIEGNFGQACFSYDDSCIYCLDMKNALIKKYCIDTKSFKTIMPFEARNYHTSHRLFPMKEGGFLMYWPKLNYVHIKQNNNK